MEKKPLEIVKEKILKMEDSPIKDKILDDIEYKKKHKVIEK